MRLKYPSGHIYEVPDDADQATIDALTAYDKSIPPVKGLKREIGFGAQNEPWFKPVPPFDPGMHRVPEKPAGPVADAVFGPKPQPYGTPAKPPPAAPPTDILAQLEGRIQEEAKKNQPWAQVGAYHKAQAQKAELGRRSVRPPTEEERKPRTAAQIQGDWEDLARDTWATADTPIIASYLKEWRQNPQWDRNSVMKALGAVRQLEERGNVTEIGDAELLTVHKMLQGHRFTNPEPFAAPGLEQSAWTRAQGALSGLGLLADVTSVGEADVIGNAVMKVLGKAAKPFLNVIAREKAIAVDIGRALAKTADKEAYVKAAQAAYDNGGMKGLRQFAKDTNAEIVGPKAKTKPPTKAPVTPTEPTPPVEAPVTGTPEPVAKQPVSATRSADMSPGVADAPPTPQAGKQPWEIRERTSKNGNTFYELVADDGRVLSNGTDPARLIAQAEERLSAYNSAKQRAAESAMRSKEMRRSSQLQDLERSTVIKMWRRATGLDDAYFASVDSGPDWGRGYQDYSQSANAAAARSRGALTPTELSQELAKNPTLKGLTRADLEKLLPFAEHHTSKYYNRTKFIERGDVGEHLPELAERASTRRDLSRLQREAKKLGITHHLTDDGRPWYAIADDAHYNRDPDMQYERLRDTLQRATGRDYPPERRPTILDIQRVDAESVDPQTLRDLAAKYAKHPTVETPKPSGVEAPPVTEAPATAPKPVETPAGAVETATTGAETLTGKARIEAARARLQARNAIRGTELPGGIPKPKISKEDWADWVDIARGVVEEGAAKFEDFSKAVVGYIGDHAKPHLKKLWGEVKPEEPRVTGTARRVTDKEVAEGFFERPEGTVRNIEELHAHAKEVVDREGVGYAEDVARKVKNEERPYSAKEEKIILEGKRRIFDELEQTEKALNDAVKNSPDQVETLTAKRDILKQRLQDISDNLQAGSTEWHNTGAAMQYGSTLKEGNLESVIQHFENEAKRPATEAEKKAIAKDVERIQKEIKKAIPDWDPETESISDVLRRVTKESLENVKAEEGAKRLIQEVQRKAGARPREVVRAERIAQGKVVRERLLQSFRTLGAGGGAFNDLLEATPQIVRDIKKYIKLLIEEHRPKLATDLYNIAKTDLDELLKDVLPDGISETEVRRILAGVYDKSSRTVSEVERLIRRYESQSKIIDNIVRVAEGEPIVKGKPVPKPHISVAVLRKQLQGLIKEMEGTPGQKGAITRLKATLAELEAQMKGGFRPVKKGAPVKTPELQAIADEVKSLRTDMRLQDKIDVLTDQLRTGDIQGPSPRVTKLTAEQALKTERLKSLQKLIQGRLREANRSFGEKLGSGLARLSTEIKLWNPKARVIDFGSNVQVIAEGAVPGVGFLERELANQLASRMGADARFKTLSLADRKVLAKHWLWEFRRSAQSGGHAGIGEAKFDTAHIPVTVGDKTVKIHGPGSFLAGEMDSPFRSYHVVSYAADRVKGIVSRTGADFDAALTQALAESPEGPLPHALAQQIRKEADQFASVQIFTNPNIAKRAHSWINREVIERMPHPKDQRTLAGKATANGGRFLAQMANDLLFQFGPVLVNVMDKTAQYQNPGYAAIRMLATYLKPMAKNEMEAAVRARELSRIIRRAGVGQGLMVVGMWAYDSGVRIDGDVWGYKLGPTIVEGQDKEGERSGSYYQDEGLIAQFGGALAAIMYGYRRRQIDSSDAPESAKKQMQKTLSFAAVIDNPVFGNTARFIQALDPKMDGEKTVRSWLAALYFPGGSSDIARAQGTKENIFGRKAQDFAEEYMKRIPGHQRLLPPAGYGTKELPKDATFNEARRVGVDLAFFMSGNPELRVAQMRAKEAMDGVVKSDVYKDAVPTLKAKMLQSAISRVRSRMNTEAGFEKKRATAEQIKQEEKAGAR